MTLCARELQAEQVPTTGVINCQLQLSGGLCFLSPSKLCLVHFEKGMGQRPGKHRHINRPQASPFLPIACKAHFLQAGARQDAPAQFCQQG